MEQQNLIQRQGAQSKTQCPETRKWLNAAGPRKSRPVVQLIKDLEWLRKSYRHLYGVKGVSDSESIATQLFASEDLNPAASVEMAKVGEKYAWSITNGNLVALADDLREAIKVAKEKMPIHDERRDPSEIAKLKAHQDEKERKRQEENAAIKAKWDNLIAKAPTNAGAVIFAEHMADDSDSQTDYWASHATRRMAIGFRTGSREDFRQLRAAAALHPETAYMRPGTSLWNVAIYYEVPGSNLPSNGEIERFSHEGTEVEADAKIAEALTRIPEQDGKGGIRKVHKSEESFEHRENYSMGAGNYVGRSKYSGWIVRPYDLKSSNWQDFEDRIDKWLAAKTEKPLALTS